LEIPLQQFTGEDGRTIYFFKDLDEQIRAVPDRLPDPQDVESVEVDRIWFTRQALLALQFNLQALVQKAEENPVVADDDSLELLRVRRLVLRYGDDAFRDIDAMIETLSDTQIYWDAKPLPDRSGDETTDSPDPDPISVEGNEALAETEQRLRAEALRARFARIKATYESFRIDLLGGAVRAWLTDFANPGTRQIESLRATIEQYLRGWLPSVAGHATAIAGSFLLGLAIMTISIFYFLKDGPRMIHAFMRLSPLDDRYEQELLGEFDTVSRAVVLATLLSAVVQGILAGMGYFFVGFQPVVLLTLLTTLFAFVPFVGAAAVWVPASLWLAFVEQRFFAAVALFVYGALIVSMADNVVKPYVLHGQSKLHPLLALLSVLGGVQALGPIGILVGPMVVSFLQALLNILNQELSSLGSEAAKTSAVASE
jgi:predicted PurR-regulated permease PerM